MKKFYTILTLILVAAVGFVAKAATASVYIDDKTGVYLYTNGTNWDRVEPQLVNGQFVTISFTAGLFWNIDNQVSGTKVHQIKRNGTVIAEDVTLIFDIGYDFDVYDGDKIEIFMKDNGGGETPDDNATVTLDFGSCNPDVVTNILVEDSPVDFSAGSFKCPLGSMIFVYTNAEAYTINSIVLGTVEMTIVPGTSSYYGFVEGNTTLAIDATSKTDAITAITTGSADARIYNLQGVEVNPAAINSGIYIINGKKVKINK